MDVDDELPDGFLRVGVEYEDGTRISNLGGRRRLWATDREPEGPILLPRGGGSGQAGGGRVTMNPGLWLWPLPPAARLDLAVEWPAFGLMLSRAELDGAAIVQAAARSQPLWIDTPDDSDPP